VRLQENVNSS